MLYNNAGMHFDFSLTFLIPSLNMGALVQREHPRNSGGIEGGARFWAVNLQYIWSEAYMTKGLIGSRIRAFDSYQNQWPWMTLNGRYALLQKKMRFSEPTRKKI